MPAYSFEALDAQGETRRGVMEADTAKAVRGLLRAQALVPLEVVPVSSGVAANEQGLGWGERAFSRAIFSGTGLAVWTRQLAGLVTSGLPLERALTGQRAWITGLRREQSDHRAEVPFSETEAGGRVKLNPLADWSWGDVWHHIARHAVPYNPLHDEFYPSIGCAPCTRAISLGEDFRAGRWWWEDEAAKECGLHVNQEEKVAA